LKRVSLVKLNRAWHLISRYSDSNKIPVLKPQKKMSQELGVRYVVEGSVQKAGDKVRINAQLIDTAGGHHLWLSAMSGT
jgi:TolB-like protein